MTEIIKTVNKEYTLNSEKDDNKISVNNYTIHSKDIGDMLGKCILWYKKQKEADLSKLILYLAAIKRR